jgi:hypothetical protein
MRNENRGEDAPALSAEKFVELIRDAAALFAPFVVTPVVGVVVVFAAFIVPAPVPVAALIAVALVAEAALIDYFDTISARHVIAIVMMAGAQRKSPKDQSCRRDRHNQDFSKLRHGGSLLFMFVPYTAGRCIVILLKSAIGEIAVMQKISIVSLHRLPTAHFAAAL